MPQKRLHNAIQRWIDENCSVHSTLEAIARECLDNNVFTQKWLEQATLYAAKREVHEALRACNPITGLSYAIPTGPDESGSQLWRQRKLVGYNEWNTAFKMRVDQMEADYASLHREHEWAMDRFGKAPLLPVFVRSNPSTNVG